MIDETVSVLALAANGGYDGVTRTISVTATYDDMPPFTATEAESYVVARDCVVHEMRLVTTHGTVPYENLYRTNYDWCSDGHLTNQGLAALDPLIPLGQAAPNSLPNPSTSEAETIYKTSSTRSLSLLA